MGRQATMAHFLGLFFWLLDFTLVLLLLRLYVIYELNWIGWLFCWIEW